MKKLFSILISLGMVFTLGAAPKTTGMTLIRESFSNGYPGSDYANAPTWCYHEDSFHLRVWQGTLAAGESFSATARFCTEEEVPPYGPGGEFLMYAASTQSRQPITMSITYPDGSVHPTWWWKEGVAGCVAPVQNAVTFRPLDLIDGGIYTVTITNVGTRSIRPQEPISMVIRADLIDNNFQMTLCPPEDRRLV